ncbi:META domain-containing protein [Shimia sp. FJ5]|uniref:META domain-containing protein n=1 Tax=Shimia sp. FJ5 TaxID=3079054 RepID=UPI00260F9A95|nr:META domain-containing protein [Shimia sp. FJ5]MDV4146232.1 META domain-containing protein [Shimia sp. FJ5]
MLRFALAILLALPLSACFQDETVTGYGGDRLWDLTEIDGAPFTHRATLRFEEGGNVSGQAPCNRFFMRQTAPYPWLEFSPIAGTKMACPDYKAEAAYLDSLREMTLVEISGDVMILSNEAGRKMVFSAAKADG